MVTPVDSADSETGYEAAGASGGIITDYEMNGVVAEGKVKAAFVLEPILLKFFHRFGIEPGVNGLGDRTGGIAVNISGNHPQVNVEHGYFVGGR